MIFTRFITLIAFVCAVSLGVTSVRAQEPPAEAAAIPEEQQVDVLEYDVDAPGVTQPMKIVEFEAVSIGRMTKYMVLLPEDYYETEKRYPVLYLLHGLLQNYTIWPVLGVAEYMKKYDLIVVMPDAGNSWYINWAESNEDEYNNWEDFIVYDIVHSVDQTFRTVASREGRAINGISMGGYGAMTLGLRHPSMFSSIGSHSGALGYARNARTSLERGNAPEPNVSPPPLADDQDANVSELVRIPGFTMQHERYPNGTAFTTVEQCNSYDPFFLITQVPARMLPHIYLDCGLQDTLVNVSQELAAILMANNIPFTYGQTPGEHRPSYWTREIAQSMAVQYAVLERNVRLWEFRQEQAAAEAEAAAAAAEAGVESGEEEHAHPHPHNE